MAASRLSEFMATIRLIESGSKSGNYLSTKAGGRIVGAYGFSIENWRRWSAEVGLEGADWRSKAAQDAVARAKFSQLYGRWRDWRLVAAAWFGGSDAAALAKEQGVTALTSSLRTDVNRVVSEMGGRFDEFDPADRAHAARSAEAAEAKEQADIAARLPRGGRGGGGITYVDVPVMGVIGQQRQAQGVAPPDPATIARLRASQMHQNMSSLLQGLSNAIRQGASGLAESQSALSPAQDAAIETAAPEEAE